MKDLLDDGDIEPLVTRLREIAAAHADAAGLAEEVLKQRPAERGEQPSDTRPEGLENQSRSRMLSVGCGLTVDRSEGDGNRG